MQQGELIGQIHAYQKLLKGSLSPNEELVNTSLEQLKIIVRLLEKQLLGNSQ